MDGQGRPYKRVNLKAKEELDGRGWPVTRKVKRELAENGVTVKREVKDELEEAIIAGDLTVANGDQLSEAKPWWKWIRWD